MSERVLIVSSAAPDWKPLTDITWATMAKYAARHGYDFHTDVSNVVALARSPMWGEGVTGYMPIRGFIKLDLLLHFLDEQSCRREYDRVCWLDADMLITNYKKPLPPNEREIILPYDANGHNATVIMVRNTARVRSFLWACNNAGRTMFLKHDWAEMEAMRYFMQTPPYWGPELVDYVSVKTLCAMPPGVYPIPDVTRKQYEWADGDFAVHFSALPLEIRVQMAREWTDRLGLL